VHPIAVLGSPSLWLGNHRAMLNIIHTLNEVTRAVEPVCVTAAWSRGPARGTSRWGVIGTGELKDHGAVVAVHVHLRSLLVHLILLHRRR
jgi:hypothetical protein